MAFHTCVANIQRLAVGKTSEQKSQTHHSRVQGSKIPEMRKQNLRGKIFFAVIILIFQVVFWSVALQAYFRSPEDFLKAKEKSEQMRKRE